MSSFNHPAAGRKVDKDIDLSQEPAGTPAGSASSKSRIWR